LAHDEIAYISLEHRGEFEVALEDVAVAIDDTEESDDAFVQRTRPEKTFLGEFARNKSRKDSRKFL
jgi:hypothetical protein